VHNDIYLSVILNVVQDYIFTEKTFSYRIDFIFHSVLGGGLTCALPEGAAKVINAGKATFLRHRGDGKGQENGIARAADILYPEHYIKKAKKSIKNMKIVS